MAGAIFTMWTELGAATAAAVLLLRVDREVPFGLFDLMVLGVLGVLGFVLTRRIVHPSLMSVELRYFGRVVVEYRSTSWLHGGFDGLYAVAGATLLAASEWRAGPDFDPGFGLGVGFLVVPSYLLALRLVFYRRAREV